MERDSSTYHSDHCSGRVTVASLLASVEANPDTHTHMVAHS